MDVAAAVTNSERLGLVLRTSLMEMQNGVALETADRGATLSRVSADPQFATVLRSGICAAVKSTPGGQQQTVALYVPWDIVDHEGFTLGAARSTVTALEPVSFFRLPHARLRAALANEPKLSAAFCNYVAFQGLLAQEWLFNLGRRSAYERTAHLFCEITLRMRMAGMGNDTSCPFPLTQTELADMLGLSVVHVNRTLQRLRQDGHIVVRRGRLEILNWPDAVRLAGFDMSYLDNIGGA